MNVSRMNKMHYSKLADFKKNWEFAAKFGKFVHDSEMENYLSARLIPSWNSSSNWKNE